MINRSPDPGIPMLSQSTGNLNHPCWRKLFEQTQVQFGERVDLKLPSSSACLLITKCIFVGNTFCLMVEEQISHGVVAPVVNPH